MDFSNLIANAPEAMRPDLRRLIALITTQSNKIAAMETQIATLSGRR